MQIGYRQPRLRYVFICLFECLFLLFILITYLLCRLFMCRDGGYKMDNMQKKLHTWRFTDNAWMSLTHLVEASTSNKAILKESTLSSTCCNGSKSGRASSTIDKSHGAVKFLDTGWRRSAPFMNWQTRGCWPAVLSPNAYVTRRYSG